ncbi:Myb-like_DNA-binding domain-containing protein [Hexamita inflata]|uniref:Myb-like DNA-binding domain-containing protein n=1 Tax=Hexamita inflata TaxID=28002 RepID=A0AA86TZT7_9EUKA|nr:Myb-like DNA-binding domain-containing protein [Hexamita inflata]
MQNIEPKHWSEQEKTQLISSVEQSKRNCGQINWAEVAKQMPDRTKTQCKSYFMNILKKKCNVKMIQYHSWTEQEERQLMQCAQAQFKNWDKIQEKYFPHITVHKLQVKYSSLLQKRNKENVGGAENDQSAENSLITQLMDILNGVAK